MKILLFLIINTLILIACSDYQNSASIEYRSKKTKKYKLAVILPLDNTSSPHWKNTVSWFNENLSKAFALSDLDTTFSIETEWFDENTVNMDSLGEHLAKRDDIQAIIGPLQSGNVDIVANYCSKVELTLIAPMATSAEISQKYSDEKWFFNLTETDITQVEILLDNVVSMGGKSVAILASKSLYGQTFIDWFGFFATEFNLEIKGICSYKNNKDFDVPAKKAFESNADYVICVPNHFSEVPLFIEQHKRSKSKSRLLFSSSAYDSNILNDKNTEGLEIFSAGASPESGFDVAYYSKFNMHPIKGEAQFYDALMISAFTLMKLNSDSIAFHTACTQLLANNTKEKETLSWDVVDMSKILRDIHDGIENNIYGASGSLNMDSYANSLAIQSIYTHWIIHNQQFEPLEYVSSDGAKRISKTYASANWIASQANSLTNEVSSNSTLAYSALNGNYALLVAGSSGWINYRHQADVLKLYKKLKILGMDDNHIILITQDDLAENLLNPHPGTIVDYEGNPLNDSLQIDYKSSELNPAEDITSILLGEKNERLPQVIKSDSTHNILVFWCGHGENGFFDWVYNYKGEMFSYTTMKAILKKMSKKRVFRKMLWLVETCFSGSVCKAFDEIPISGALCISSANEYESSKNDEYSTEYMTYMTNSFTKNLMYKLNQVEVTDTTINKDISLGELYNYMQKNTVGSHVSVYGKKNLGSLRNTGVLEFLAPKR